MEAEVAVAILGALGLREAVALTVKSWRTQNEKREDASAAIMQAQNTALIDLFRESLQVSKTLSGNLSPVARRIEDHDKDAQLRFEWQKQTHARMEKRGEQIVSLLEGMDKKLEKIKQNGEKKSA